MCHKCPQMLRPGHRFLNLLIRRAGRSLPIEFGRILADCADELINLYRVDVTSLAALLIFVGLGTYTRYARR
jgi:hypothetical protein